MFTQEVGVIPPNYSVHHLNEDKDDNRACNLCVIESRAHSAEHMKDPERCKTSGKFLKDNNSRMQELALATRKGEYIGIQKQRELSKGNKHRDCAYCGKHFTLKVTDKNGTKYCSFLCGQRGSMKTRIPTYAPMQDIKSCLNCGGSFSPITGNQKCCSNECRKVQTELARKANYALRPCTRCGEDFETIKSSKRKYCSDACREYK